MSYELLGILLTVVMQAIYFAHKMGVIEKSVYAIERKQDKYNNVIERTFINERDISILKEQIKNENHRIEDLEEGLK